MKEVAVVYHDHLDPEWARCLNRTVLCNSILLRSYADLWDWIIDAWLEMEKEGYRYTEGQALVWRTYLERHPEQKDRIKQLIRDRKLEILLQGELTPDTNCIPAEGLARNYLLAAEFYREFCGEDYSGTKIAWVFDTFGNNANMPQILKLAGAEVVGGTKYRVCPDDIWVGIDGTKLPCIDSKTGFSDIYSPGQKPYYRLCRQVHCEKCRGYGCPTCNGRGFVEVHKFNKEDAKKQLRRAAEETDPVNYILIGGEEVIPNHCILEAIEELNEEYKDRDVHFRFGDFSELWENNRSYYERQMDSFDYPTEELNPVHQGCYVTRIRNKQYTRAIAYKIIRAEGRIAIDAWKNGMRTIPPKDLTIAWQNLMLNMHHDSISGAHIDSGNQELMDYLREAEAISSRYLSEPIEYKAPRARGIDQSKLGLQKKIMGELEVEYDLQGIRKIIKNGQDLFGTFKYEHQTNFDSSTDNLHIGELVIQSDTGDNHNAFVFGDMEPLGKYHYAVFDNGDHLWWRGKHDTGDPCVRKLFWETRVWPSQDGKRLDFVINVHWDTQNKRLRIVVPVNSNRKDAVWEIPYGFIRRTFDPENIKPYGHGRQIIATRPVGEYPALHWVAEDMENDCGVAILNKGIPSWKWAPGRWEASVLRSPIMTGDTVFPSVEELWDVDGLFDTGDHCFEFSVWPYNAKEVSFGMLTREGYAYNKATPEVPFDVEGNIVVTTFKISDDGSGYILRVQEAEGENGFVRLRFKEKHKVTVVNFLEKTIGESRMGSEMEYPLHKHEILSLKIQ